MTAPSSDDVPSDRSTPTHHERDLVARIRVGDIEAFEAMYRDFAPALLGFATMQLRSHELAEELVQDVFFNIWKHRDDWVLSSPLKWYLFRSLRNRIASYTRTHAARHELRQGGTSGTQAYDFPSVEQADDRVREAEFLHALERAIAALPPRRREVFLLVRQQELSYAEAAAVFGISVKAVEMHMLRAFEVLADQLDEWSR